MSDSVSASRVLGREGAAVHFMDDHECLFMDHHDNVCESLVEFMQAITDATRYYGSCFVEVVHSNVWLYKVRPPREILVLTNQIERPNAVPVPYDSARKDR